MTIDLTKFFQEEKKRVYKPGPDFAPRVVMRLKEYPPQEAGFWEVVLAAQRPILVLGAAVALLAAFQEFAPIEPSRGLIAAYMEAEGPSDQRLLFSETETPNSDVLEAAMVLEND